MDKKMLFQWSRNSPIEKMNRLELSAFLAHSAPEGSEEQCLFFDANHYYDATRDERKPTMPNCPNHTDKYGMRASRRFKKAMKLLKARTINKKS